MVLFTQQNNKEYFSMPIPLYAYKLKAVLSKSSNLFLRFKLKLNTKSSLVNSIDSLWKHLKDRLTKIIIIKVVARNLTLSESLI